MGGGGVEGKGENEDNERKKFQRNENNTLKLFNSDKLEDIFMETREKRK